MSEKIPEDLQDLFDKPVYVTLATVMPDGQPQLSVVWASYDGEHVLVNTARGRQKEKNMIARPMATVLAVDPEDPYRRIEVRGTVEVTEEGALDHINALAKAYRGVDKYFGGVQPAEREGKEIRVKCKITPTRVVAFNPKRG
ncbi:MAG: PPOX class F420-dependent oxidoreductase [Anaerolineae bacterium]|nr:PPOX class F420-dependent oxidoreductase [Anaerolineae bacterium]